MALKPQDVVVALKLLSDGEDPRPYALLAQDLGMSASEVHGAIGRLREGRLVEHESRRVRRQVLIDFLESGLACVFPAREGEMGRGIPTAWASAALKDCFRNGEGAGPVWPHSNGSARGPCVTPLYKSVPDAAMRDPELYDYLALVDALRLGRARERKAALKRLNELISNDG